MIFASFGPSDTAGDFFMTRPPSPEEAARAFAAHGMQVVGPPLAMG